MTKSRFDCWRGRKFAEVTERDALGETVLTEDHHGGTVEFARDP